MKVELTMDKLYPLLLDGRERDALLRALYRPEHSKDEVLCGIRNKLLVMITEIEDQPLQAEMDRLAAAMARLMRQIG
jgi:hypothetical protein